MIGRETDKTNRKRIVLFRSLFFLFLGLVLIWVGYLQIFDHAYFSSVARGEHYRGEVIEPRRGWIYDRSGNPLATSIMVDSLILSPKDVIIENLDAAKKKKSVKKDLPVKLAARLAVILNEPESKFLDIITRNTTVSWVPLTMELTPEQYAQITVLRRELRLRNELRTEKYCKRLYPKGDAACHILGPVGIGSMEEGLGGWGTHRPLGGLEAVYQPQVSGNFGQVTSRKDGAGRLLVPIEDDVFSNLAGNQMYLTIDEVIQRAAEDELAATIEKHGAHAGFVVVMDPKTGEILALANYPKYDLSNYRSVSKDMWREVSSNRAVEQAFEPGSIFKVFTAAAALETGKVKLTDTFNGMGGRIKFAGRTLRDTHSYSIMTFAKVIEVSSNIGTLQIAQKLGSDRLYEYIKKFGFGNVTGVGLPGESSGLVLNYKQWTPLVWSRVSFGHSVSVNAIQMCAAYSVIANGGKLLKPHLVKSIRDENGRLKKEYKPEVVRQVLREDTAREIREIMQGVVDRGTGKPAAIPGVRVAGKTGTAQVVAEGGRGYLPGRYMSSFVGFLPVEDPRLVIGVFIDQPTKNGYYGGTVAAPAFKRIAEAALTQLGIFPEAPPPMPMAQAQPSDDSLNDMLNEDYMDVSVPVKVQAPVQNKVVSENKLDNTGLKQISYEKEKTVLMMPNLKGLAKRVALVRLTHMDLVPVMTGSGVVLDQYPKPGATVIPGQKCQLILGSTYQPTVIHRDTTLNRQ